MSKNIEQSYKTLAMIWFALLFSQFMFLLVIFLSKPEVYRFDFSKPVLGENAAVILAFAALAITNFVLSFVMKKRSYEQAIAERQIAYVQTGLILACAFCEAITLLGMVLAIIFTYQYFFAWFVLGIAGILLHFPRRADVIAASYKK
jgi:hypothetical protein